MSAITSILVAVGVLAVTLLITHAREASRLKDLPGPPPPSKITGHALDLHMSPVGTRYNVWAKQYGYTYKLYGAFSERWLIMGDPKGISHVLSAKALNYVRPHVDRVVLGLWFGQGLFTAEGDEHQRMRKILSPAFTYQSVKDVSHIFYLLTDRLTQRWDEILGDKDCGIFDIAPSLHTLTLDAISMSMFMHDIGATNNTIPDLLQKFTNAPQETMLALFMGTIVSAFPRLLTLPSPMKTWAGNLRSELRSIAEGVWRGATSDAAGLDAKLLRLLNERGEAMSKEVVVANIIGVLFAGSESSANVISEILYEMALHEDVQTFLREEIHHFEHTSNHPPSFDDLMNPSALPYLDAVVREGLRCKAVLMDISRVAVEDDVIPLQFPVRGTGATFVRVKAGQTVMIPVRDGVNCDEEIWGGDAPEFRPERWTDGSLPSAVASIQAQGHTLTFGHGPKVCLGRTFAIAEIKAIPFHMRCTCVFFDHIPARAGRPGSYGAAFRVRRSRGRAGLLPSRWKHCQAEGTRSRGRGRAVTSACQETMNTRLTYEYSSHVCVWCVTIG